MSHRKAARTPIESDCKLTKPENADEQAMAKYPFQNLIWALMYLSVTTRPDIAFAVNFMSQFNSNYDEEHWKAGKRILRYLSGFKGYGLLFTKSSREIYGVVDADWGPNLTDRRSYSGYAFILAGAAISWEARKQRIVALSSTETQYMALSKDLGMANKRVLLFNDSQSANKLIQCMGYRSRTKHIDVRHHFVKECHRSGKIELNYMPSEDMPADVLTKGLSVQKHNKCIAAFSVLLM
ncbi:secreted RxLR effector protein 161-like [Rhagoletis pomonella]|uniref:secreted RxLR effector protein 161-like n=1 Tax=Rhagoletis pomonella TaxID=28610 RepID=UPI00177CED65|nr:secreted RxLR effector protein 161-like [Rhagoletis pomonella]